MTFYDYDDDIEKCMGCGGYYGQHPGLRFFERKDDRDVAPQLCAKCWRNQGYPWPERYGP
jgi:hypothetical protein